MNYETSFIQLIFKDKIKDTYTIFITYDQLCVRTHKRYLDIARKKKLL